MEEAAELLGINMEDLQIDGNLHIEAENEASDETLYHEDDEYLVDKLQNMETSSMGSEKRQTIDIDNRSQTQFENIDKNLLTEAGIFKDDVEVSKKKLLKEAQDLEVAHKCKRMIDVETKIFNCDLCDYKTHNIKNGYQHFQRKHIQCNQLFQCEKCIYRSKHKSHLKEHVEQQHSGLRYDCDGCDFQSSHKKDVKRHKLRKHNDKIKPFQCFLCPYTAVMQGDINIHKVTRHKEVCINCDLCPQLFVTNRGLERHKSLKHDLKNTALISEEKPQLNYI